MTRPIRFLRIDDRLVHGQVIVGWLPHLQASHLLVINEKTAADSMRREMLSLSVPGTVRLLFATPTAIEQSPEFPLQTLAVVGSPRDAWAAVQSGLVPEILNVGGLHSRAGREEIREALHLDAEDRDYLQKFINAGIMPVFQPTPQNEPEPLSEILQSRG